MTSRQCVTISTNRTVSDWLPMGGDLRAIVGDIRTISADLLPTGCGPLVTGCTTHPTVVADQNRSDCNIWGGGPMLADGLWWSAHFLVMGGQQPVV